ncbi:Calx-beta domain-containing protein [Humitalea sp. 24SJ18S-53]|uniref:Calx-beta domain-containing protein n=1 Tax=Humitalea sp. 24SJ18S-53 TaxID=3422307 RepID=UPI003D6658A8
MLTKATFATVNDWGAGFIGQFTLTNGPTALNGWTFAFDAPFEITNIWNAKIVSHVGNRYVVTSTDGTNIAAAGGTLTFGFQAGPGGSTARVDAVDLAPVTTPVEILPAASITDASIVEGASGTKMMVFTVTLSAPATGDVSVGYTTRDGTAVAGSDFTAQSGTLVFTAGQTSKTISIAVLGDTLVEANETFDIILRSPVGMTLADDTGRGTITNDDVAAPTLSVGDAQVTEGNAGTKLMLFTVTMSKAATGPVTVGYATEAGTATAGSDFVAASGTLTFAAGETSKTVAITVNGDTTVEANENFNLVLRTPVGATLADATGLGTITNDDVAPPSLTVADAQVAEGNSGTRQMVFTITLSKAATGAVTVGYATEAGTATAGSDFVAATGTLTLAAGETSKTVAITVNGDTTVESNESFNLVLRTPVGATLADAIGLGTIINDDVAPPSLSVADAQVVEGNSGTKQMIFTVTLSKAATGPVTVGYATEAGTATAGSDFAAATGSLTFAAGEISKTVAVTVNGDSVVEANEVFDLVLGTATGATILDGRGRGTITNDDTAPVPATGDTVAYRVANSWTGGFVGEMTVVNDATAMNGWTVVFNAPFQISNIWNAEIVSHTGTQYVVKNVAWNGSLGANATATFGFQAAGDGAPTGLSVNGAAPPRVPPTISIADATTTEGEGLNGTMLFTVTLSKAYDQAVTVDYTTTNGTAIAGSDYASGSGRVTFAAGETSKTISVTVLHDDAIETNESFGIVLSNPSGATLLDGTAVGTIRDNDGVAPPTSAPGYYSTSGNQIVDSDGNAVRLQGVNWFGMETGRGSPDGLHARNWQDMMDQMLDSGFNMIRLPFCLDALKPGAMPNDINYAKNPDLQGLTSLQIMDKIVDYAGDIGMKILLDNHRSAAGGGPNGNGLWYDGGYTEANWIDSWKMLAARYAGDSTVIGVDLQNEPHGATWSEWSAAAERAGNAIQSVNPNLLVIVEGVGAYQNDYYWWGGQLEGVRDDPVVLNVANKVVYSPHDYPNSVYAQPWFQAADFKDKLAEEFREHWGYIYGENIAPILLGEFGTKLQDAKDIAWLDEITQYLNGDFNTDGTRDVAASKEGMSFAYWSWNPNSGDTGGILNDDWTTVNQAKLDALGPILF